MAEQVKLALDAIGLQERKALEHFYAAVRRATLQVRILAERYGGDVAFSFDSNGRSVWVMALFGKGAPALTLSRRPSGPPQGERDLVLKADRGLLSFHLDSAIR